MDSAVWKQRLADTIQDVGSVQITALALGVGETQVFRYLAGEAAPCWPVVIALAKFSGVSLDWLAGREVEPMARSLPSAAPDVAPRPPGLDRRHLAAAMVAVDASLPGGRALERAELLARLYDALGRELPGQALPALPNQEVPHD